MTIKVAASSLGCHHANHPPSMQQSIPGLAAHTNLTAEVTQASKFLLCTGAHQQGTQWERYLQALLGTDRTAHRAPQESIVCALSTTGPGRQERKVIIICCIFSKWDSSLQKDKGTGLAHSPWACCNQCNKTHYLVGVVYTLYVYII